MRILLQVVLLALFIFATLAYGAVHYWAYSIVFGATFALCAIAFLSAGFSCLRKNKVRFAVFRWPFVLFLGASVLFISFQLAPLPGGVLKTLSPYAAYLYEQAHVVTAPGGLDPGNQPWGYLSLDRDKSAKSLLALAAYLGFGFLVLRAVRRPADLTRITLVLITFSVGLSLYGLFNLGEALPKTPGVKNSLVAGARVSATLINPDHFAGYLVLAIYLAFGYLVAFLRDPPTASGRNFLQRGMSMLNAEGAYLPKALLLLFAIAVMTFVMFYTLSRGAVVGFSASLVFCFLLLFIKSRRSLFLLLMIPPAAFIAYYIRVVGADPLLQRLQETGKDLLQADDNARIHFYRAGLELWRKFPLFGSGLGSFEVIAPLMVLKYYQGSFIPYIHNDWLQLAVETGWVGGMLFVLGVGSLFASVFRRWWRTEDRFGFGFGLAAMSGMIGMGIHAFLDFGLRVPINALFLALLISLALAALDEGFGRKRKSRRASRGTSAHHWVQESPGRSGLEPSPVLDTRRLAGVRRWAVGLILLTAAALCAWSSLLMGRYGLAQNYCPSEIDTVHRRDHGVSASKLQKALRLNPLNGDYWLNLALLAGVPDAADAGDETRSDPSFPDGGQGGLDIIPKRIPGWERARAANASLQDWAYGQALLCSPAAGEFWLAYADSLREGIETGEPGAGGRLIERTVRSYAMAVELQPNSRAVRERAADFSRWLKQKDLPDN